MRYGNRSQTDRLIAQILLEGKIKIGSREVDERRNLDTEEVDKFLVSVFRRIQCSFVDEG